MSAIQIHNDMNRIISWLYRIRFWHHGDQPTVRELGLKRFYCIYYLLFIISVTIGSFKSEDMNEKLFLAEVALVYVFLWLKLWILIWKQKEILKLLNQIGVFSIRSSEDASVLNNKVAKFMKIVVIFVRWAIVMWFVGNVVTPFLHSERSLLFAIAFPMDWKTSAIAFFNANAFIFTASHFSVLAILLSIIIWYLMLHCSLRYQVLQNELKRIGRISENPTFGKGKFRNFLRDLRETIRGYVELRKIIDELESFLSKLILIQFCTSGICICLSVYSLAFNISENVMEYAIHFSMFFLHISELFLITYFGNEIMLSSDRLSYSLFESDWIEQPQATKTCVIIFGEHLQQRHKLLVAKLYPLTLETFTKIINSAYSMFNIVKSSKQ